MKLQKRFIRKVNGKDYYKYIVQLPPENIETADFSEGDELETVAVKGEIRLRRA